MHWNQCIIMLVQANNSTYMCRVIYKGKKVYQEYELIMALEVCFCLPVIVHISVKKKRTDVNNASFESL